MANAGAPEDVDVIIAGAGIAGATLALALNQAGLKPVLIDPVVFDAQVAPTFDGRASAIAYAAFRQWRALGVGAALEPHAQRIEQIPVTDGPTPRAAAGGPSPLFPRLHSPENAHSSPGEPPGYPPEKRPLPPAPAQP